MALHRRQFIQRTSAIGLAFWGLKRLTLKAEPILQTAALSESSLGPLIEDPAGLLDLPEGFHYQRLSEVGQSMDDGLRVPGHHDGMGSYELGNGRVLLIRNHELESHQGALSAFGENNEGLTGGILEYLYDVGYSNTPALGGVTSLIYNTRLGQLEKHWLSLGGTQRNCAGGVTPWSSWITCEESVVKQNESNQKNHGYNFEVRTQPELVLQPARPLRAMGRFYHEAVAVDPRTGIVYQTEDRSDGLLYRFLPAIPGQLERGGRLQALKLRDEFAADTRNWWSDPIAPGNRLPVEWVDLQEVESPKDDLRYQGRFIHGAAVFARGEGTWLDGSTLYFACTNGGPRQWGQIWKLSLSGEGPNLRSGVYDPTNSDELELFIESKGEGLLKNADNLTIAPWGDIIVCEDRKAPYYLTVITKEGQLHRLGQTRRSEFAGPVFSPDGSTLFVNIQVPGVTLAIQGPWTRIASSASAV